MESRFVCHADSCAQGNIFHKNSTIVELPNGDLLAAWFAGDVGEGNRDQNIYGSRLPAGEDQWTDSECLVDVPGRTLGCPVLFMGPEDQVWLTAPQMYGAWILSSRILFKRSLDYGETWKDLEILSERQGLYLKNKPLYLEDENRWILGVDIDHRAREEHEKAGFLLIPGDYLDRPDHFPNLVGGDQISPTEAKGYIKERSQTENQAWGEGPGLIYPTAVELSDGSLLAYIRPRPGGYLWETRSYDRGINWTEAEPTDIPNPDAGFDLLRTESGNLVLIVNPSSALNAPNGRNTLGLFLSEDEGKTWPYQFTLEHEDIERDMREIPDGERPEFTYGNLIQGSDGTIHITFEYRRRGIKHVEITEDEIKNGGSDKLVPEIAE